MFRKRNGSFCSCSWERFATIGVIGLGVLLCVISAFAKKKTELWKTLPRPVAEDIWVRPASSVLAQPIWGHANGIRVGLHPMSGPRGLLRVFTPYMGQPDSVLINFIAVEPIAQGEDWRSFSEMEQSKLDKVQGKRFWSANSPEDETPRISHHSPASGVIEKEGTTQTLTVYILVEPFDNGAKVYLRLRFHSERPYEFSVAAFARKDSKPLKHCILTATMGNFARLRELHLKSSVTTSLELWRDFKGDDFTPHAEFSLSDLIRNKKGHALFIAAPNEKNPEEAKYSPDTVYWWKYQGKPSTQYWRCVNPQPQLKGLVNGRACFWGGQSPIPGGVSFENFELMEPFKDGAEYWFGITPQPPMEFIKSEME